MWQYLFLTLRRQPGKTTMASSGFLLAACALILLSGTTQTTVVQANQIISQSWHSSYDLVVLPPNAKNPSEQTIPADFLQSYDGGISMQQYALIKQLPGVEVAAPIAYIGYVGLPSPKIYFPSKDSLTGYYQLNWTLSAFNGQRQIVEYQNSTIYEVTPCVESYNTIPVDEVLQTQYDPLNNCPTDAIPPALSFVTPDSGSFLLAAIDPDAEHQLVHLDQSITDGRMLTSQDMIHNDKRLAAFHFFKLSALPKEEIRIPAEAIPMIIHQQLPGQITLTATLTQLASGVVSPSQLKQLGGASYLTHRSNPKTFFNGQVPLLQNDPQRFTNARLSWDGHAWQVLPYSNKDTESALGYLLHLASASTPAGLTYQPATAPGGGSAYSVMPTGVQGAEVAFRQSHPLHTLKKDFEDAVYTFESVGQFAGDKLATQFSNPLNWLPENTYTVPPVILRYDAQGHPVTPTTLLPTTNQAGYIVQPPLALTTLAAAQQLKGDNLISVIRVRVSGVEAANPASWKRVQQVAGEIEQRTGLRVLVTLGSSPRPTLVYVPGVKQGEFGAKQNIDPVGWVEERWIAIGVSILYLAQLGVIRFLLIGAVLAVCLGYVVLAFSALVAAQRREFAVLHALGWRPWHPARLFLGQALLLGLGGGIVGLGVALLVAILLEATPIWLIVAWTLPVMLGMALLSSLYPLWQIWRIRPAEILRSGSSISSTRASLVAFPLWSFVSPLTGLVVRNLARSRPRTLVTIGSLFLSAVLLVLMVSGILALHQMLTGTLLGNFVLLQTAVPQIAGGVFTVLLTLLSVADLLLLQVRERQQEIGLLQAVGWRPRMVHRLFVQEGLTLALIGTIPGVLVALGILAAQHTVQSALPFSLIALGAVLLLVGVSALATIPALRAMNRVQVVNVLRAE